MVWTPNLDLSEILSGPYFVGKGAAGSEFDLGEVRDLAMTPTYERADQMGGSFYGTATILGQQITGVNFTATFGLFQHIGNDMKDVMTLAFPGAALSAGTSSRTITFNVGTICGTLGSAYAVRWVFHKVSEATKTVLTDDIVFPNAVVYPAGEPVILSGEETAVIPMFLQAYPDSTGNIAVIGADASST